MADQGKFDATERLLKGAPNLGPCGERHAHGSVCRVSGIRLRKTAMNGLEAVILEGLNHAGDDWFMLFTVSLMRRCQHCKTAISCETVLINDLCNQCNWYKHGTV